MTIDVKCLSLHKYIIKLVPGNSAAIVSPAPPPANDFPWRMCVVAMVAPPWSGGGAVHHQHRARTHVLTARGRWLGRAQPVTRRCSVCTSSV